MTKKRATGPTVTDRAVTDKIVPLDRLAQAVANFQSTGKVVVQSHGVYDLIHPGIVQHLTEAKKQGDALVVTVIMDKDVRRGPGRPVFGEKLRAQNVAALQMVDFACIVDDEVPFECVKRIGPDVFARGQGKQERDRDMHRKIFEEEKQLRLGDCRVYLTDGFSESSSGIINTIVDIYPDETKQFLADVAARYPISQITEALHQIRDKKVLVIGDGIIDEYCYTESMGKSAKSQVIVHKYLTHEEHAGGVFAVANHLASLCDHVDLVSMLGKQDSRDQFVLDNLRSGVNAKFFYREDGPTITKRRYISQNTKQKLFEINYINDMNIGDDFAAEVVEYLEPILGNYDLVMVSDFGHGFIAPPIIRTLEQLSRKLAVNAQTNGANTGFNYITRYRNLTYACLDAPEARLATQEKHAEIEAVARGLSGALQSEYLTITMGREGSISLALDQTVNRTPSLGSRVVDTVGAGDAFFAYTAPCITTGMPLDMTSFIGNAVGALAVQVVGNRRPIEEYDVMEFVKTVLKT